MYIKKNPDSKIWPAVFVSTTSLKWATFWQLVFMETVILERWRPGVCMSRKAIFSLFGNFSLTLCRLDLWTRCVGALMETFRAADSVWLESWAACPGMSCAWRGGRHNTEPDGNHTRRQTSPHPLYASSPKLSLSHFSAYMKMYFYCVMTVLFVIYH